MACRLFVLLVVSAIASMMPWSTMGCMFSPWDTFRADLGERVPPQIWARRLSCERSGPKILCISWSVRMGYVSRRTCALSSLAGCSGEEGRVDMGESLLEL